MMMMTMMMIMIMIMMMMMMMMTVVRRKETNKGEGQTWQTMITKSKDVYHQERKQEKDPSSSGRAMQTRRK